MKPRIAAIEPSRILHGTAVEATITGDDFQTGLSVQVDSHEAARVNRVFAVWLGSIRIANTSVQYVSPNELTVDVPATLVVGSYDVRVTTPAGRSATLRDGLTVYDPSARSSSHATGGSATTGGTTGNAGESDAEASGGAARATETGGASGASTRSGNASGQAGAGGLLEGSGAAAGAGGASGATGGTQPASGGTTGSAGGEAGGSAGRAATLIAAGASGSASSDATGAAAGAAGAGGTPDDAHTTLWTDGRLLKDTCGRVVTLRGVEQTLGAGVPLGNDWAGLMDELAATGANVVRIIPDMAYLTLANLDAVMAKLHGHDIITMLAGVSHAWLGDAKNRAMLAQYGDRLILDVWLPPYDDRALFVSDGQAAVELVRSYGYTEPLVVSSNDYGKDLPALLQYGETLVAADPEHNLMLGWDAYWGSSNAYQNLYGMTLSEGIGRVADAAFPVVMGLTRYPDGLTSEDTEYADTMSLAQTRGIGWLWWTWYSPLSTVNSLSSSGSMDALTALGVEVVTEHAAGIARTSVLACQMP